MGKREGSSDLGMRIELYRFWEILILKFLFVEFKLEEFSVVLNGFKSYEGGL